MSRISFKAVAVGFLLTLGLDILVGMGLLFLHGDEVTVAGRSAEQVSQDLANVTGSTSFLLVSIALGTLTTLAGGCVTARLARRYPYFNGLAVGVLGALFGLLFWSENPVWFNLFALVTVIPTALLGAHIGARNVPPT
ncbi:MULTISPECIES: hypothetical protein [unclassified Rhizobacter]|uniref:hypothetical protein n=1 Tax=unclassified Rhizobacter TaxID=2640088 RepID=UPI0006FF9B44|nr:MULTISPECIES: hypothetical protein [unclassified Rhizobacter]KQU67923.1 hypothetical protein ASC88_08165 [Rhizobacter sp. Root29]KQW15190.1 hypothetical protein ASC98_13750 [Rhizobacter sp. Root1238]KRB24354.1 hypothetical protein ASE08_17735 [Rhizobacter sp. Root16D2]